jgi:hypothetical protein
MELYPAIFEKYWDVFGDIDTEGFVETTTEVILTLEEYEGESKIVSLLIPAMERIINNIKTHG